MRPTIALCRPGHLRLHRARVPTSTPAGNHRQTARHRFRSAIALAHCKLTEFCKILPAMVSSGSSFWHLLEGLPFNASEGRVFPITARQLLFLAPAVAAAYVGYHVAGLSWEILGLRSPSPPKIVPAPRDIPDEHVSDATEPQELMYTPQCLPGARDVETPYGTIKVFESGPKDGKRVLFIPGISTPCLALANIAGRLALEGCRVMLFGKLTPAAVQDPYGTRKSKECFYRKKCRKTVVCHCFHQRALQLVEGIPPRYTALLSINYICHEIHIMPK